MTNQGCFQDLLKTHAQILTKISYTLHKYHLLCFHFVYLCITGLKTPLFSFFRNKILWLLEKSNMADRESQNMALRGAKYGTYGSKTWRSIRNQVYMVKNILLAK